jgi:hypothetical protein
MLHAVGSVITRCGECHYMVPVTRLHGLRDFTGNPKRNCWHRNMNEISIYNEKTVNKKLIRQ